MTGRFWDRRDAEPHWVERGSGGAAVAVGTILELAIPLADLWLAAGQTVGRAARQKDALTASLSIFKKAA